ncbi:hypothetical protein [Kiloniella sp.]|uniref:hypothetical protein n=1 Tax=Kiloniella sp. TaxID=1938587 RepID=UPI003B01227A
MKHNHYSLAQTDAVNVTLTEKLAKQADVGGARNLINQYALKDDTRNIEQRDQLAWKIVERVKVEKANALEDSAFKKIMSKSVMEKGVDWKQLFDHANAGKEREYLDTLTREEKSVHRDVLRYRELDRAVGQHYKEALKEGRDLSVSREDTSSWKEMLSVGATRDRVAHTLGKSEQDFGDALKHYRVDQGKFAARVDRLEMVSLVDRYEGAKQEGRLLNAGEIAKDILARVSIEKLDNKPRVTARELFARGLDFGQLRKERGVFNQEANKADAIVTKVESPEITMSLEDWYNGLSKSDKSKAAAGALKAHDHVGELSNLNKPKYTMSLEDWYNGLSKSDKSKAATGALKAPDHVGNNDEKSLKKGSRIKI